MTGTPKDKRARALERIKALSEKRGTASRPDQDTGEQGVSKGDKRGSKRGTVPHRPQGG